MSAREATPRPSGLVTFLFTDIEGSTVRWERDQAAMTTALRRHDEIVRACVARRQGFVFKTIGDAFCVAFQRPEDAVAAALDAQRLLDAEDFSAVDGIRVRMALHSGSADERDDDYFGPAVNRVARLLAIGHGGQVLVSGNAADLVAASLPPETTLLELGEHRLKDLERPEFVHQLSGPGLAHDFPQLRSLRWLPNNLPQQLTSLVGREREVSEVASLIQKHRAVTLIGAGGIGKTRIALQAGANVLEAWPDGVWFVELAPLSDPALLPGALVAAIGLQPASEGDARQALIAQLAAKRLLLILDNCEHLIEAAGQLVAAILRACPGVGVLASSRQALGIAGEVAYRTPSLEVPSEAQIAALDAESALAFGAVALFVARAGAADAAFRLTADNAPAVARICRRLDGIALAIELAAARVRVLSPEQLRRRLDQRFRMLTGGARDAVPRQQTLRATIDWSYDLLAEDERRVLRSVAIFVDGFTLEAATAVAGGDHAGPLGAAPSDDMFDVLGSLADKSLVQVDLDGEQTRFRLLESMRAYALEKLEAHGERDRAAARHLEYFRALGERAEAAFRATGADEVFMQTLALELEDLRAALTWALNGGDVAAGASLIAASAHPWSRLGHTAEGIARLEAFIAAAGEGDAEIAARLWSGIAWLAGNGMRSGQALEAAQRAVAYARAGEQPDTLVNALENFAIAAARVRDFARAQAALDEAETLSGKHVAPGKRGRQLELRGFVSLLQGDLDSAARAFEAERDVLRSLSDEFGEANVTQNLAELEHARGRTARAIEIARALRPRAAHLLGREQYANLLGNLAGYLLALDETAEGRAVAREALTFVALDDAPGRAFEATAFAAVALEHLALGLALEGRLTSAARLYGFCEKNLTELGYAREYTERATHERLDALLDAHFPRDMREALDAQGRALAPHAALELAHAEHEAVTALGAGAPH